jgi:hypothetical protein
MFRRKRPDGPPPEERKRRGRFFRREQRGRRRSLWICVLALIGLAAIAFLLTRYLIIPLLVLIAPAA